MVYEGDEKGTEMTKAYDSDHETGKTARHGYRTGCAAAIEMRMWVELCGLSVLGVRQPAAGQPGTLEELDVSSPHLAWILCSLL